MNELKRMQRIVIKVGTSSLTRPDGSRNLRNMDLLASSVTAAVYTIAVPLLLLLIVRRLRRGRRACKHYRITPASRIRSITCARSSSKRSSHR